MRPRVLENPLSIRSRYRRYCLQILIFLARDSKDRSWKNLKRWPGSSWFPRNLDLLTASASYMDFLHKKGIIQRRIPFKRKWFSLKLSSRLLNNLNWALLNVNVFKGTRKIRIKKVPWYPILVFSPFELHNQKESTHKISFLLRKVSAFSPLKVRKPLK